MPDNQLVYIVVSLAIIDGLLCLGILLFFLKLYFWSRKLENRIQRIEEFTTSEVMEEEQVKRSEVIKKFYIETNQANSYKAYDLTMSTFNLKKFDP